MTTQPVNDQLAVDEHRPRRRSWLKSEAALVAQVWLLSRASMALLATVLAAKGEGAIGQLVVRWDVLHYLLIAGEGYRKTELTRAAFFPGLPILLRAGTHLGIPAELTGVVLSLIGSALATAALYRLFGVQAACFWALAPTAIFTAVGYTEGLFCAAGFWAWQRAKVQHWLQAGILAGLACGLRITGVFLLGALVILAICQGRQRWRRLVWLLLPLAVLVAYEVFLYQNFGSWLAWLEAQQGGWERGFAWPWDALRHAWTAARLDYWPGEPWVTWVFRAEIISMAAGLVVTIWCLWRRRWPEAAYVGVQVLVFGTSFWYMSINRAILVWFPLWALLGAAAKRCTSAGVNPGWKVAVACAFAAEFVVMMIWAWLFLTGQWAS